MAINSCDVKAVVYNRCFFTLLVAMQMSGRNNPVIHSWYGKHNGANSTRYISPFVSYIYLLSACNIFLIRTYCSNRSFCYSYSTAQLQGNIPTHLDHVQDVSEIHAGHVWDTSRGACLRCVQNVLKMHPSKRKTLR